MTQKHNRFQKYSGMYSCSVCGKKTRETGLGESHNGLCAYCFLEGGLENALSDGNMTQEEFDKEINALKETYNK